MAIREVKSDRWRNIKKWFLNLLDSQSRLNLDDCSDTIGTVGVRDGGVLLAGVVAEQQHLLVVEGVFRPGGVGQWAGGGGATRVVGVTMVYEIY